MHPLFSRFPIVSVLLIVLVVVGCTSRLALVSKNAATPAGVDLSGYWLLRKDPNSDGAARRPGLSEPPIFVSTTRRPQRSQRRRSATGVSAQIFLEFGESLKVTQTGFGLFISYDRAIVEEYTFGENRVVNIGPIEAFRVSGWEGSVFAVETLDDSGTTLFEAWHLEDGGAVLVRDVRIAKDEKSRFSHRQVFDRQ